MSETGDLRTDTNAGIVGFLWRRKVWWLLPLAVLLLLIGIIYIFVHMSSADAEMYPTTSQNRVAIFDLC